MGVSLFPVGPTAKRWAANLKQVTKVSFDAEFNMEAMQSLPERSLSATLRNLSLLLGIEDW